MNKKISLCIILIISLCINMVSIAYASDISYKKNVKGRSIKKETGRDVIYDVEITWENMQFIYTTICTRKWDEKKHTYTQNYEYEWENTGNAIYITNHSNKAINTKCEYIKNASYGGINGNFTNNGVKVIESAENKKVEDSSLTWRCDLSLTGSVNGKLDGYTTVGHVCMTID